MRTPFLLGAVVIVVISGPSGSALAQRERVAHGVTEARQRGNEAAMVHLSERIGPAGVAECLEHAGRAGRLVCVQSARYLEQPWPVLPILASILRDHDRQLASRAAESMVAILSSMEAGDLGAQEPLPEEIELLLGGLSELIESRQLSLDIRAQAVMIYGALARMAGAAMEAPRNALGDPEAALRRAAVSALSSSREASDIELLAEVVTRDTDLITVTQAAAMVCEATLLRGRPLPGPVAERIRAFLEDQRGRPSILRPILACVARSDDQQLRALAARHPNESTREAWQELIGEGSGR